MALNFNSSLFEKSLDEGKRKNEELWSAGGGAFKPTDETSEYQIDQGIYATITAQAPFLPVKGIPNEATINEITVFGNAGTADETWIFQRTNLTTGVKDDLGTAAFNVSSGIIPNDINNDTFSYGIRTSLMSVNDEIFGTKIFYTI